MTLASHTCFSSHRTICSHLWPAFIVSKVCACSCNREDQDSASQTNKISIFYPHFDSLVLNKLYETFSKKQHTWCFLVWRIANSVVWMKFFQWTAYADINWIKILVVCKRQKLSLSITEHLLHSLFTWHIDSCIRTIQYILRN